MNPTLAPSANFSISLVIHLKQRMLNLSSRVLAFGEARKHEPQPDLTVLSFIVSALWPGYVVTEPTM